MICPRCDGKKRLVWGRYPGSIARITVCHVCAGTGKLRQRIDKGVAAFWLVYVGLMLVSAYIAYRLFFTHN